jgi:hypothetical protein
MLTYTNYRFIERCVSTHSISLDWYNTTKTSAKSNMVVVVPKEL